MKEAFAYTVLAACAACIALYFLAPKKESPKPEGNSGADEEGLDIFGGQASPAGGEIVVPLELVESQKDLSLVIKGTLVSFRTNYTEGTGADISIPLEEASGRQARKKTGKKTGPRDYIKTNLF